MSKMMYFHVVFVRQNSNVAVARFAHKCCKMRLFAYFQIGDVIARNSSSVDKMQKQTDQ